jgi:glycosyltransferase involved in cell wall biosynthesis
MLNIYAFVPQQSTISYDYRVMTILKTASDLGLPLKAIVDTNIEGTDPQQRIKNFCEADVVLMYQPIGEGTVNNIRMAKAFLPSKQETGWKYPPTFIIDTDDNLFRVDPHNPAFKALGYCDPETGRKIQKGEMLSEVRDGKRYVLWHYGPHGQGCPPGCNADVDCAVNEQTLDTYRQMLQEADCVTCTTPRSAAYVKEHASPKQVHVTPNLMRFQDYPQVDLAPNKRVTILWQGGQNHWPDWYPLKDSIANIARRYPDVQWLTWGVNYSWVTEVIPVDRLTFMPWVDWREYKVRRAVVGEDISLPTRFNDCRSAIKFYEASMAKRPGATLAQRTGPYADEIIDGQTGLLFDGPEDFETQLARLIEDAQLRLTLGANAKQWVSENRDAVKKVPELIRFYEQLREEKQYTQPHMPLPAWEKFEASVKAQQEAEAKAAEEKLQPA